LAIIMSCFINWCTN